jgi:hypothetical protein
VKWQFQLAMIFGRPPRVAGGLPNEKLELEYNLLTFCIVAGVDICHDTVTRRLAEYKEVPACDLGSHRANSAKRWKLLLMAVIGLTITPQSRNKSALISHVKIPGYLRLHPTLKNTCAQLMTIKEYALSLGTGKAPNNCINCDDWWFNTATQIDITSSAKRRFIP